MPGQVPEFGLIHTYFSLMSQPVISPTPPVQMTFQPFQAQNEPLTQKQVNFHS